MAWCGHVDSVLSRRDILRLPSVQLSALYAARLVLILESPSGPGRVKNSRACPAAIGLHARGTYVPRVDQCPFDTVVVWRAVPWRPPVGPCVLAPKPMRDTCVSFV